MRETMTVEYLIFIQIGRFESRVIFNLLFKQSESLNPHNFPSQANPCLETVPFHSRSGLPPPSPIVF